MYYTCMWLHMYTCVWKYVCDYICTYVCEHIPIHTYPILYSIPEYSQPFVYVYNTHVYVCITHVFDYIRAQCTYMCVNIYKYIHTLSHNQILSVYKFFFLSVYNPSYMNIIHMYTYVLHMCVPKYVHNAHTCVSTYTNQYIPNLMLHPRTLAPFQRKRSMYYTCVWLHSCTMSVYACEHVKIHKYPILYSIPHHSQPFIYVYNTHVYLYFTHVNTIHTNYIYVWKYTSAYILILYT